MEKKPVVSIIIPALNEEGRIEKCLSSINDLDAPEGIFEIILIDNGSSDRTGEIAKGLGAQVYSITTGTISRLRNYGALKAKGEIFAFVDADCVVSKDWLKYALKELENESVGATGSNYQVPDQSTWVSKAWGFNMRELKDRGETNWIQSGNLIIKRDVFNLVGGFDEHLSVCEDSDICYRIKDEGYKIMSNLAISSYHLQFAETLGGFFKKELWHGKDILRVFLKSKNKKRYSKIFVFTIFFFISLFSCFIFILFGYLKLAMLGLIAMAILSFILAVKLSLKKKEFRYITALTVLFLTFGIARATSLIAFRNSRNKK